MRLHPRPVRTTAIDGVLLVDKPSGVTSHDVVAIARRVLRTARIGHTGTLDPFATGLLVLLIGRATRLAQFVQDEPKVYEATIAFGSETSTDDLTGSVTHVADAPSTPAIDRAIESLTGKILQRPPDFSAKKVAGRRAYTAARAGEPLVLEPVPVVVHQWLVTRRAPNEIDATITCGGGTYIRALARDLGRSSGSAAHLTKLRRTRSGVFDVTNAVSVPSLEEAGASVVSPLRLAITHLPSLSITDDELRRVRHGNAIDARDEAPVAALVDGEGNLVAIARREDSVLQPRVVLCDD